MSRGRPVAPRALIAGTAAIGLMMAAAGSSAQETVVGVNAAVRNIVALRKAQATQAHPAQVKERVALNDEVSTGAASQLQILLMDRSTFTVGSNARLTIDRFVYDPGRNSRSIEASVARGAFRFMSGRTLNHPTGPVAVRTPVASIGIRGTIFEGVVGADAIRIAAAEPGIGIVPEGDPEAATLIVLRGPGKHTQGDTIPGAIDIRIGDRTIPLERAGLALYLPGKGLPPVGPFMISMAGRRSFQDLLRTTPPPLPAGMANASDGAVAGSGQAPVRAATATKLAVGAKPGAGSLALLGVPLGLGIVLAANSHSDRDLPTSP